MKANDKSNNCQDVRRAWVAGNWSLARSVARGGMNVMLQLTTRS